MRKNIVFRVLSGIFLLSGMPCHSFSQKAIIDSNSTVEVFAPGVVSSPYTEWATSFSPDGNTVYFSRGAVYWTIVYAAKRGDGWSKPVVAPFSGRWRDTDPFMSPDGKRMYFISNRPAPGMPADKAQPNFHIWYVDHLAGDSWGTPQHLGAPVNQEGIDNYAPSISSTGSLCFCSRGRDGNSGMSSYCARPSNEKAAAFLPLEKLLLLGTEDVQDPFIAPDESYILFVSGNDLYITYRDGAAWSKAAKLPGTVNDGNSNSSPYVGPDKQTLYYSSGRVKGFYKRDPVGHALTYDELTAENESLFNGQPNILKVSIQLPKAI